jgi:hypothetical protein
MMAEPPLSDEEMQPGPGPGEDPSSDHPSDKEARQAAFLAEAPEWAVVAPGGAMFANATWYPAGGEVLQAVREVFAYEEFRDLSVLPYAVRWRRRTKPFLRSKMGDEPLWCTVEIVPPRIVWEALKREDPDFPRLLVDLNWGHWEDALNDSTGMRYVHRGWVQRTLHHALSMLELQNDILKRIGPDVQTSLKTAERFGAWLPAMHRLRAQLELWPTDDGWSDDEPA